MDEIKKAVRACDVVIVCLSRNSVTKEGTVQREIKLALDVEEEKPEGTIFVIPVLLEDAVVPERLSQWQYVHLVQRDGYRRLVRALRIRANQRAAATGDPYAMYRVGLSYVNGQGVAQDYREARLWFEKAAASGHAGAMNYLGVLYNSGLGVPLYYEKAREWQMKAAAAGDLYAMYNLGLSYANGRGVDQDYKEARGWFEKAAAGGHPGAMNHLGILYNSALGVPKDYEKAREWHERAAAAGEPHAMYNLGLSYANGRGVVQDGKQALLWFEKAAAAGNENAKKRLREAQIGEQDPKDIASMAAPSAHGRPSPRLAAALDVPVTASDLRPGEPTVKMFFPQPVLLTVDHNLPRVRFNAGIQEVPQSLAKHAYLKANGVLRYQRAETGVIVEMEMSQAERIRDEFSDVPEVHTLFRDAVIRGYRDDAQLTSRAADPAKIPVKIQLDLRHATRIRDRYRHLGGPTDQRIYAIISDAIKK